MTAGNDRRQLAAVDGGAPQRPHRRRRWRIGAIVVAVGLLAAVAVLVVQRQFWGPRSADLLTAQGPTSALFWVDDQDAAKETRTVDAHGVVTRSVPMRKGQRQGVVIALTNQSAYDVTVVGSQAPWIFTVQTSISGFQGAPEFHGLTFGDHVTIAPGETHYLEVMTTPESTCVPYSRGTGLGLSDIGIVVSAGWVTKNQTIASVDQAFLTSQTDTTPPGCVLPGG